MDVAADMRAWLMAGDPAVRWRCRWTRWRPPESTGEVAIRGSLRFPAVLEWWERGGA